MGRSKSSSSESSDNEGEKKLHRRAGINLAIDLTDEEKQFRAKLYPDVSKVKKENLKCTVCSRNIVPVVFCKGRLFRHIVLDVLVCEECLQFYGDGNFSTDEDGEDKYCRWCGQGGKLYCCSKCTCVFCKKCVKQNLKRSEVDKLEQEDWQCFVCEPKPLFPLRAKCWAVQEHLQNENRKKGKPTSKQDTSKRRHSSSREDTHFLNFCTCFGCSMYTHPQPCWCLAWLHMCAFCIETCTEIKKDMPNKPKKKDQGPPSKKTRLRAKQSADDSSNNDKPKLRKQKRKEDSADSDSSEKSTKNEKTERDGDAINRSDSLKRENSVLTKRKVNHDSREGHISSKKSSMSVNSSNDSSESKRYKDKNLKIKKKDKHNYSVSSSDGSKSKPSIKSSDSRDSSVCSESNKTKKQIKLARKFLLSTIQNIEVLGKVMLNRVKMFETILTPNTLQTQNDVLKAIHKLNKMLIVVNKNVNVIQEALENNMKNWAAVMNSNTLKVSPLILSKSEGKNENERMDTDELDKGSTAAASESVKDTVIEGDAMITNESEKPEFPNSIDLKQANDDVNQTVIESTENGNGTEIAGTETDSRKETVNGNGDLTENKNESGKTGDAAETENGEVNETDKKSEDDEITVCENKGIDEGEDDNKTSKNLDKKESDVESLLDLHLSDPEHDNKAVGENGEKIDGKKKSRILEDDKAVLAELLNDSSNEEGSVSDDKKQQPVSSSTSSDEDRNKRKRRRKDLPRNVRLEEDFSSCHLAQPLVMLERCDRLEQSNIVEISDKEPSDLTRNIQKLVKGGNISHQPVIKLIGCDTLGTSGNVGTSEQAETWQHRLITSHCCGNKYIFL